MQCKVSCGTHQIRRSDWAGWDLPYSNLRSGWELILEIIAQIIFFYKTSSNLWKLQCRFNHLFTRLHTKIKFEMKLKQCKIPLTNEDFKYIILIRCGACWTCTNRIHTLWWLMSSVIWWIEEWTLEESLLIRCILIFAWININAWPKVKDIF